MIPFAWQLELRSRERDGSAIPLVVAFQPAVG